MKYKKVYQYIKFEKKGTQQIKLTNGYAFSDLDEFDYSYEWICNGKAVRNGDLHLSEGNLLEVPSRPDKCGELCLNVYATLKESTTWAEKGFKVAKEQLTYHDYEFPQLKDDGGKATFKETPEAVEIIAADALFTIEKGTGALVSWRVKGEELLHSALEPYFWKPANDIQVRNGYNERLSAWKNCRAKTYRKGIPSNRKRWYGDSGCQSLPPPDRSRLPSPLHCGRQRPHTSRSNLSA